MIANSDDFSYFLEADRLALGVDGSLRDRAFNYIYRFERLLRKVEYYINTKANSRTGQGISCYLRYRLLRMSILLGIQIPPNVFGPGLSVAHPGSITVNGAARVGSNCRIHSCVNIGTAAGFSGRAPTIGNNVYIGPGAKIFGKITIGDDIAIGANSVVNKSFNESGITIAGVPARKVSDKGSKDLLIRATEKMECSKR